VRPPPFAIAFAALALALAGCRPSSSTAGPEIATTTSYLEAAARDLLGDHLTVLRLTEPGTCPGHFDIRPSQVARLRRCRALLRFDFQQSLDPKLAGTGANAPRIAPVTLSTGKSRPDSYLSACRQIADHLVALDLLPHAEATRRLQTIAARLDALARQATQRVAQARLVGLPVIASSHQRDFCEWLGLDVVASFRPADTASIGEIQEAIDAGTLQQVRLVVANLPEGRRTADALAGRLKTPVAVFENFPALRHGSVSFDAMLQTNVAALLQSAAP